MDCFISFGSQLSFSDYWFVSWVFDDNGPIGFLLINPAI